MSSRAGRCNSNERGSSYDRRARREWLLSAKSGFGGDGDKVPCWECGAMVNNRTMIVDRIVPGEFGGRYTRSNIRPHCCGCSGRQGQRRTMEIARETSGYGDDDACKQCGVNFWAATIGRNRPEGGHKPQCPVGAQEARDRARGW